MAKKKEPAKTSSLLGITEKERPACSNIGPCVITGCICAGQAQHPGHLGR